MVGDLQAVIGDGGVNADAEGAIDLGDHVVEGDVVGGIDDGGVSAAVGDAELALGDARAAVELGERGLGIGLAAAGFQRDGAGADGRGTGVGESVGDALLGGDELGDPELIAAEGRSDAGRGRQDVGIAAVGRGILKSLRQGKVLPDLLHGRQLRFQSRIRLLLILRGSDLRLQQSDGGGVNGDQPVNNGAGVDPADDANVGGNLAMGFL